MALGYRPISITGTGGRWGAALRTSDRSALVWLIPFGIAAVYIVVFIAQLPHNIWALGWVSDYASGFTIPETIVNAGAGGHTVLGYTGAWIPLWFGLLTAWVPLHRQLWELAPTGLFLISALTVGWSVGQVANRRAAVVAALLILVASPGALGFFMAAVAHNTVYPSTALLGAYLIWLTRADGRRRATQFMAPLLAGIALGASIASDVLVVATGVIPFALTAILAGLHRDRRSTRVAADALITVAVAVPVAKLTSTIMESHGFVTLPLTTKTASLSTLPVHAELMWEGLKSLSNGYLGHTAPGVLHTELGVACDVIAATALITLLLVGAHTTAKFVWSGLRSRDTPTSRELATSLHIVYWVSSALAISAAFALSLRSEAAHSSYYATIIFSVAAVVPLLMRSRSPARWLVPVGTSIFFAASLVGLTSHYLDVVKPISSYEGEITRLAKANHVTVGYAGYWDASSLTWSSDEQVLVRPVGKCGEGICPFPLAGVTSWYAPTQRSSFLLVDTGETYLSALPKGLKRPVAAYTFGPLRMYVYSYDIASLIAPPSY